jgi:serine/threonine-protein phosphatase 2A activator
MRDRGGPPQQLAIYSHVVSTGHPFPCSSQESQSVLISAIFSMSSEESSDTSNHVPTLGLLDISQPYGFTPPKKRINEGEDVPTFLMSKGYADIMTFLMQLNRAMFPSYIDQDGHKSVQIWEIGSSKVELSKPVLSLRDLIAKLESFIQEAPPDTGPRRFGNVSFRRWYDIVRERMFDLLEEFLPHNVFEFQNTNTSAPGPRTELEAYFVGSFGSSQRLDYGTGHELSFLAFLGCIWKLRGFEKSELGVEERGIVIGVIEPYVQPQLFVSSASFLTRSSYLNLCRKLIKTYTLEPAGSHGVWGLDDHFFIPYIFGSAQLSPAIRDLDPIPLQGSGSNVPDAPGVAKPTVVVAERDRNMYFSAVGFIQDVKRGPFWEHSPMLFDISGVRAGWAKINKVTHSFSDREGILIAML